MEERTSLFGSTAPKKQLLQKDPNVDASLALRTFHLLDDFPWVSKGSDEARIGSAYATALACQRIHNISEDDAVRLTEVILERIGYHLVEPMSAIELWGYLYYTPVDMECYTDYSKFELLFRNYARDLKVFVAWIR